MGKNEQKVTSYTTTADGYKAIIHSVMYNEKGKKLMEGDLEVRCEGGTFIMDCAGLCRSSSKRCSNRMR